MSISRITIRGILQLATTLFALAGCENTIGFQPRMGVTAFATAANLCSLGVSPRVRLSAVPQNTASFNIRLQNVGVIFSEPQDFFVDGRTLELAEGALTNYRAPCPGENQRFEMRIEIVALDAENRRIAYGTTRYTLGSTSSMQRLRQTQ